MAYENDGLYNQKEACQYLGGISRNTLYLLRRDGLLAETKLGWRVFFKKADLDRCIEMQELLNAA